MSKLIIAASCKRKYKITTVSNHGYGIFSNTLNRQFDKK